MVFDSCLWVGIDVLVLVGVVMALWCAIRTFAKHATELGNQQPAEPVFFVKPNNCLQRFQQLSSRGANFLRSNYDILAFLNISATSK